MTQKKIDHWYATRRELGGCSLTTEEIRTLIGAHSYHFGLVGKGKLTPAKVAEYVKWQKISGE